jgi:hypothetical protein
VAGAAAAAAATLSSSGCWNFSFNSETGTRLAPEATRRIVVGKTTQDEVFHLFGPPHSIFEGQVEIRSFYLPLGNRFLATPNEKHYGVLYRFDRMSSSFSLAHVYVVGHGKVQTKVQGDELFLLIDKTTGVVEDVAYRDEKKQP